MSINIVQSVIERISELRPQDFSYDKNGVSINGDVWPVDDPRFWFAQCLACFDEPNDFDEINKCTINKNTELGDNVQMGSYSVIGGRGFGYVERYGEILEMPHHGRVIIGDHVRIGSNVCIDRGVLDSTIIRSGTKIDNLVHIAHGAKIGSNCLIAAGAIIGGSAFIGDDCKIWIGARIFNKIIIGNGATIGAGAVVRENVGPGETWVGNPARKIK